MYEQIDHLTYWDINMLIFTIAAGVSGKHMAETGMGAILVMNYGFPKFVKTNLTIFGTRKIGTAWIKRQH